MSGRPLGCKGCGCAASCVIALAAIACVGWWTAVQRASSAARPLHFNPRSICCYNLSGAAHRFAAIPEARRLVRQPKPSDAERSALAARVDAGGSAALALVRAALAGECTAPSGYTSGASGASMSPGTGRLLAASLVAMAEHRTSLGRAGEGVRIQMDAVEAAAAVARGTTMTEAEIGIDLERIAAANMERRIPRLSNSELARTAARLDRIIARRTTLADTVHASCLEMDLSQASAMHGMLTDPRNWMWAVRHGASAFAYTRDTRKIYSAFEAECRRPYAGGTRALVGQPGQIVSRASWFNEYRIRHLRAEARLAGLRGLVAAALFRSARGRFPADAAELAAAMPPGALADPFARTAGVLLRYTAPAAGSRLALHSVGPNQADDGGAGDDTAVLMGGAPAGRPTSARALEGRP